MFDNVNLEIADSTENLNFECILHIYHIKLNGFLFLTYTHDIRSFNRKAISWVVCASLEGNQTPQHQGLGLIHIWETNLPN